MSARDTRAPAPDQTERDAAIRERHRNVLIDAGAGTGKTTILVDRLVEMLAPSAGAPAIPIERIAAITFTRKAAGELRFRIRERLLRELAEPGLTSERQDRLRSALAGLDTAHVGTIHAFADRLLRRHPVEAGLSPAYQIAEDEAPLVRETFETLLHSAENGTLADALAGTPWTGRADEVTAAIHDAIESGVRPESDEREWTTWFGLDALVKGFIALRDVPPPDGPAVEVDLAAFQAEADAIIRLAAGVSSASFGGRWIARLIDVLREAVKSDDPARVALLVRRHLARKPPSDATRQDTFSGDDAAWKVWQALGKKAKTGAEPLISRLRAPLDRSFATRLVRFFPVVVALYEKVKAGHGALDQVDLLLKLRDLLVGHFDVRREYQGLLDHIFVDEFQDTDPLQAEIVLFLCEREPRATRWEDVALAPGRLTLVGDPKQSIYRFRRADIAMYDAVRQVVKGSGAIECRLSANFRSVPPLIDWLNDRFERVLGVSTNRPFDPVTGQVFHQPLLSGRDGAPAAPVHVLPFELEAPVKPGDKKPGADGYRALEGEVLARYLRWLVEASGQEIVDPLDGQPRRVRWSDIAVLAVSTWRLHLLFPWLDEAGIPYASRGGSLFLKDSLHQQFLLGLRAVADRDDGVAEAALLRPPFFALDPADLLLEQAARRPEPPGGEAQTARTIGPGPSSATASSSLAPAAAIAMALAPPLPAAEGLERVRRAQEARELVREIRRDRFARSPGATARDLLDRTALARAVALGPNGAQRLARLRELCLVLEQRAAAEGLDYDAVTAQLRQWVDGPIQLDPPYPVGAETVQVLTVHQAKGLEFPVVVFWDGRCQWDTHIQASPWRMERDRRGWMLALDGLAWEEPAGLGLRKSEASYLDAERKRVVYVAATRARDLLVLPRAGAGPPGKIICAALLADGPTNLVRELDTYKADSEPAWARMPAPPAGPAPADALRLHGEVAERWTASATQAAAPRFRPAGVSAQAAGPVAVEVAPAESAEPTLPVGEGGIAPGKPREGRFGSLFGQTVHEAIAICLRQPAHTPEGAVRAAAARTGLAEHLAEAAADVGRALQALAAEGIAGPTGPSLRVEYPVAGAAPGGLLLTGYIDLVAISGDRVTVIDFKTDAPPPGAVENIYPQYAAQVRAYAMLLTPSLGLPDHKIRRGLLFTATGSLGWL
ncbi:MAG TPA: UvrD-helicase domain-containing protein [Candidatus Binatia bacterium]|nr:UvrD-helicase domain-containing protein [Candidatus Binatia bacterium]